MRSPFQVSCIADAEAWKSVRSLQRSLQQHLRKGSLLRLHVAAVCGGNARHPRQQQLRAVQLQGGAGGDPGGEGDCADGGAVRVPRVRSTAKDTGQCLINRVGRGGVDSEGYRIDVGTCIAPQDAFRATNCSSAGPTWGMKCAGLGFFATKASR
ncbi:unnamed protein product [Closterium sp. Naga37s-1]|nr:unnamed protein product [Closterium sp. Naga37s-1]